MSGLGAAMAGGNPRLGRQKDDYYPTPANVTRALLSAWRPRSEVVWEPACGCGMMAREIEAAGLPVIATDIADRGYGDHGTDFLAAGKIADCVITNPPFDLAVPFIEHAFKIGVTEMALVLKATFWHAARRRKLYEAHTPMMILPLLWRPDFLNRGGPTMDLIWVVWDKQYRGKATYHLLPRPD